MAGVTGSPTGPLVDVAWLAKNRGRSDVRVVDLRWYLGDRKGADEYAKGHIPGAVFVDLDADISGTVGPGRHPIPSPAQIERAMRAAGVSKRTRVVVYDDAGGSIAARLWWLLKHHGHDRVHVLDGGFAAWTAAPQPVAQGTASYPGGDFTARVTGLPVVDRHGVDHARRRRGTLVLDARSPERFRGESEPVDARPGHIPGARNAPWKDNLIDGFFADPRELRRRYNALGVRDGSEVVCYCGSGVTACHDILALELAGFADLDLLLYEGSWSDWSRDPDRPASTGDAV